MKSFHFPSFKHWQIQDWAVHGSTKGLIWEAPEMSIGMPTCLSWRLKEQRAEIHMEASPMWIVWEFGDLVQMKTSSVTFWSAKSRGKAVLILTDSFRQMDTPVPYRLLIQTVLSPFQRSGNIFLVHKVSKWTESFHIERVTITNTCRVLYFLRTENVAVFVGHYSNIPLYSLKNSILIKS